MALLKIPDPADPPFHRRPSNPADFESIRILIMTVDFLTKKVDELEERIRKLESGKPLNRNSRFDVNVAHGEH